MPLPDQRSRSRLSAMGITCWVSRDQVVADDTAHTHQPRIRLASGDGGWLLVQPRPWDGRHRELLADITALIGPEHCRYGQWAGGSEAGLAWSELGERGVERVIAFGPLPAPLDDAGLIAAASLDDLATSASARRALWQNLRPHLLN